jgi:urease accessory protein
MKRVLDVTSPFDRRHDRVAQASGGRVVELATPLAAPARGVAMDGALRLAFDAQDGKTRLTDLYQEAPLRAFFPRETGADELEAVLTNVAGGLVGGDRLSVEVAARDGARALVTTQAAEKVYRSAGPDVRIDCAIAVSTGAALAWMPQPTILFDGAALRRHMRISLQAGASLHAGEVVAFGRAGSGERLATGRLLDSWEIRRGGQLVWADRMAVEDWPAVRDHPACLAGARASALFVHASDGAAGRLEEARAIIGDVTEDLVAGATVIDGLLIVRWLGDDAATLLNAYTDFWRHYRAMTGETGHIPRIWAV